MAKILYTNGTGQFMEGDWQTPEPKGDEVLVQSLMTGVCRSDIDMMQGSFPALPLHMSGHEGLGRVVAAGPQASDILIGDIVATRGEPAYADYYIARNREYVVVPAVHQRYILEPVACGVNCITQPLEHIKQRAGPDACLLILGSGFLAWVVYHTVQHYGLEFSVNVVGGSNRQLWGDRLSDTASGVYDVVVDLSGGDMVFSKPMVRPEGLVILAAQKTVTTDFSNLLWNAVTIVCPSPRTERFYDAMVTARDMIMHRSLNVDSFWSRGYNRNTEWQQAFADAVNRPQGYSRGYIYWPDE